MKRIGVLFIATLWCNLATAQESQRYIVKEGVRPRDAIPFKEIYMYPTFIHGKVTFKDNHLGGGRMNYNRFTSEFDFVEGKDTLALANPELTKSVAIGNDIFYYIEGEGFIQRLNETAYAKLAKKESIEVADRRKQNNPMSNTSYNNLITPGAGVAAGAPSHGVSSPIAFNVAEKVDVIYKKATNYYFANAKGRYAKASKKNVLKLFPEKKNSLSSYLKEHDIDYSNAEVLQQLLATITEMK